MPSEPYPGCWFYDPTMCPKSPQVLIDTYHATIGQNSFLLVGIESRLDLRKFD